jgi:hypothetical protein
VKWAIPKVSFKDLLIQVGHCDQTLLNTSCWSQDKWLSMPRMRKLLK